MNEPPEKPPLPAHLRPLTVDVPRTWTPEQALAVFELVDDLRDKVWAFYGCQLQTLLRDQCADSAIDDSNDARDDGMF